MAIASIASINPFGSRQGLAAKAPSLSESFADLAIALRSLLDPYRPELHYMRGPGPKWHAKHRPLVHLPADPGALPTMASIQA
jgi:hypothetical protein